MVYTHLETDAGRTGETVDDISIHYQVCYATVVLKAGQACAVDNVVPYSNVAIRQLAGAKVHSVRVRAIVHYVIFNEQTVIVLHDEEPAIVILRFNISKRHVLQQTA